MKPLESYLSSDPRSLDLQGCLGGFVIGSLRKGGSSGEGPREPKGALGRIGDYWVIYPS